MLRGAADPEVEIALRGGVLRIEWEGGESHVFMTGPAAETFRGRIPLEEE